MAALVLLFITVFLYIAFSIKRKTKNDLQEERERKILEARTLAAENFKKKIRKIRRR